MLGTLNTPNLVNRSHPLAMGLVSWYLALPQTASGLFWPDLGYAQNTGVLNGSSWVTSQRPGGFGAAMSFDGSDDYVAGTAVQGPNGGNVPLSCSFWCLSNNLNGYATPYFYGNSVSGHGILFSQSGASNDGTILVGVVGSNFITSTAKLAVNVWTHLTLTMDGTNANLYFNGVLDTTVSNGNSPTSTLQRIGSYVGSQFWSGAVDDVRLYWRTLSGSEVKFLYDNSVGGCPGLLNEQTPQWWSQPAPVILIPTFRNEVVSGPPMRSPWLKLFPPPQPSVPKQVTLAIQAPTQPEIRQGPPQRGTPWFKIYPPPINIQAPPTAPLVQTYAPEVRSGPPLMGVPWLRVVPTPAAFAPAPPVILPQYYAPEIHQGPAMIGAPWFHIPISVPTTPGGAAPTPPTPRPGKGHNLTLLQRDPTQEQPLRRFTEILATIINSLAGQGILVQTGPSEWTIASETTGLTGTFP